MPEQNLKEQLGKLVELQKLDTEIYSLKQEKEAKPEQIKALEAVFTQKKESLNSLEKASLDLQKKKKDYELELSTSEESTKKLQTQLYSLKTNKEYQAMLKQIADTKADASVIEDKILGVLDEMDKLKGKVDEEKAHLKQEEATFNDEKKKVEVRIKEIDEKLATLETQRKQVTPAIEPKIITAYERILSNRDGLAIVSVVNNSCGGCNMFVPPQVINLIKMYEHIITCEFCNRMLYVNDEGN